MWHLMHPHDFFIAGMVVGILASCHLFVLFLLFVETRKPYRDDGLDIVSSQDFLPHTRT